MVQSRCVLLKNRPPVTYDVLSIDIGSCPDDSNVPGARQFTTAVKPISSFIQRLQDLLKTVRHEKMPSATPSTGLPSRGSEEISVEMSRRSSALRRVGERGFCVVVVGGGAGGIELAFSLKHRLMHEAVATDQQFISEPNIKHDASPRHHLA